MMKSIEFFIVSLGQPRTKVETTVPRHNEVKEFTAKSILKTLS
jgi:hypothetical protein